MSYLYFTGSAGNKWVKTPQEYRNWNHWCKEHSVYSRSDSWITRKWYLNLIYTYTSIITIYIHSHKYSIFYLILEVQTFGFLQHLTKIASFALSILSTTALFLLLTWQIKHLSLLLMAVDRCNIILSIYSFHTAVV